MVGQREKCSHSPCSAVMCGRFQFAPQSPAIVAEEFDLDPKELSLDPAWSMRWNIAPSQSVPVLLPKDQESGFLAQSMSWGLVPAWAKDPEKQKGWINARSETAHSKVSFRDAWKKRRCLVLATGYYEWPRKGGPPTLLHREDGGVFPFAGLYEAPTPHSKTGLPTCTILTAAADPSIAPIHHRMPVLLAPEQRRAWLEKGDLGPAVAETPLLPFPLATQVVSQRLNRVGTEGQDLMHPDAPEEPPNLLF